MGLYAPLSAYLDWVLLSGKYQREQRIRANSGSEQKGVGSSWAVSSCQCQGDEHCQYRLLMHMVAQHEAAAQTWLDS